MIVLPSNGGEDPTPTLPSNTSATVPQGDHESTIPAGTTAAPKPDNIFHPGDCFNANGLKITYVSAEKYITDNMFMQPEEGQMYIRLKIHAENISESDKYISSFEFECYADGTKTDANYFSDDALTGGTLSSGRKTEGYIYFTVPENAKQIEVEYETSFWSNKKAILVVTIEG